MIITIMQLQGNEGSSYKGFWHGLERSAFHSSHTVGAYLKHAVQHKHVR